MEIKSERTTIFLLIDESHSADGDLRFDVYKFSSLSRIAAMRTSPKGGTETAEKSQ